MLKLKQKMQDIVKLISKEYLVLNRIIKKRIYNNVDSSTEIEFKFGKGIISRVSVFINQKKYNSVLLFDEHILNIITILKMNNFQHLILERINFDDIKYRLLYKEYTDPLFFEIIQIPDEVVIDIIIENMTFDMGNFGEYFFGE